MRIKDMPRRRRRRRRSCILKLYFSSPSLMITFRSLVSWIINNIILMLYTKTAKCKYAITIFKWRNSFYLNIFERRIRCWHGKLINQTTQIHYVLALFLPIVTLKVFSIIVRYDIIRSLIYFIYGLKSFNDLNWS